VFDFCSKMKVVKIMFWPYHCVEEEEMKPLVKTAQNSDVGHARTRQHAPERRLPTRTNAPHASHASSSPEWQTRPEYQMTRPTRLTRIRMTSAWHNCDVSMHSWHAMSATSQLTRQHSGTHQPHHQPWAKLSWAELSWSWAASRGIGSSVADPTCNRIWDWI
jgi:hypothetical protein